MEIYVIRHTTPRIEKGMCYGQSDVSLAESFPLEAEKLLTTLPKHFEIVYSSPSTRCYQLAKRIKSKKLVIDKRLLEMHFGDWEMKKWDEIDQTLLNSWMKDFVTKKVPNGESFVEVNDRVNDFIKELLKYNYKKVAIITHGGVIRCFLAKISKIPLKDAFTLSVEYGSVSGFRIDRMHFR